MHKQKLEKICQIQRKLSSLCDIVHILYHVFKVRTISKLDLLLLLVNTHVAGWMLIMLFGSLMLKIPCSLFITGLTLVSVECKCATKQA